MPLQPTKEAVRSYLAQRAQARTPPPSTEEIRRRLGWPMTQPTR